MAELNTWKKEKKNLMATSKRRNLTDNELEELSILEDVINECTLRHDIQNNGCL